MNKVENLLMIPMLASAMTDNYSGYGMPNSWKKPHKDDIFAWLII